MADLRFSPPSATSYCNPSCSPDTNSFRWESSNTLQISSSLNLSNGSRFMRREPENSTGSCTHGVRWVRRQSENWLRCLKSVFRTCGMIVSLPLRSCKPILEISTLSIRIQPSAASNILKRQLVRLDFPAPVRPTIPIWIQYQIKMEKNNTRV